MIAILIPIILIVITGIVIFYYIKTRHEERMVILDKGADKDQLEYLFRETKRERNPLSIIKYGLILVSIGLAIIGGTYIDQPHDEEMMAAFMFVFPGISLIFFYFISRKLEKKEIE